MSCGWRTIAWLGPNEFYQVVGSCQLDNDFFWTWLCHEIVKTCHKLIDSQTKNNGALSLTNTIYRTGRLSKILQDVSFFKSAPLLSSCGVATPWRGVSSGHLERQSVGECGVVKHQLDGSLKGWPGGKCVGNGCSNLIQVRCYIMDYDIYIYIYIYRNSENDIEVYRPHWSSLSLVVTWCFELPQDDEAVLEMI